MAGGHSVMGATAVAAKRDRFWKMVGASNLHASLAQIKSA